MSRPLVIAVLIILLGLVGVMANVVSKPYRKEEPKQDPQAAAAQAKTRNDMAKDMRPINAKTQQSNAATPPRPKAPPMPSGGPNRKYGQMDLTDDWFKRRADGEAGVAALKAKDAQEKKWQAEDAKKMQQAAQVQTTPEPKVK